MAAYADVSWAGRDGNTKLLCQTMTPLLCESWSLPLESFGGACTIIEAWTLRRLSAFATAASSFRTIAAPHTSLNHLKTVDMADNVGLTTPRGSGTSGYVQKNRSLLRPRDKVAPYPKDWEHAKHRPRQPDAEILEHEAKRDIEVKVFELRDKLEEEG
jgi:hypothetical protein